MRILNLDSGNGRDLYGEIQCEHCKVKDKLRGGYNDAFWHERVLPAWHCTSCGKNRAGETKTPEITKRNQANGVNGV